MRITLWNSLGFPIDYFTKVANPKVGKNSNSNNLFYKFIAILKESLNKTMNSSKRFKYKKFLYMLDNKELHMLAEFILEDKIDFSEEQDKLKHEKVQKKIFWRVNNICTQYWDFRTQLWLSLPINDRLLLIVSEYDKREADLMTLLIFNQYSNQRKTITNVDTKMENSIKNLIYDSEYDKREADLMTLLIFNQYSNQRKTITNVDTKMENSIKNLIYDRYISLSQQKSTEMSIKRIKNYNKDQQSETNNAARFVKFLHTKSDQIHISIQKQKKGIFN